MLMIQRLAGLDRIIRILNGLIDPPTPGHQTNSVNIHPFQNEISTPQKKEAEICQRKRHLPIPWKFQVLSGPITIFPKPELRSILEGFPLLNPPFFQVTNRWVGRSLNHPTNLPFQSWEFQAMTQAQLTTRILAKGPSATLKFRRIFSGFQNRQLNWGNCGKHLEMRY